MMNARRDDPKWREFERLIVRIEQVAAGTGIRVTSPDRLRCRITGRLREVDASLIRADGHLTTIECRKRRGRQGVTWIEQLVTKKCSLGADRTVAISASGFSSAAEALAAEYRIEIKRLDALAVCDLNPLLNLHFVVFWHRRASIVQARLRFHRPGPWSVPRETDWDHVLPVSINPDQPIFRHIEEGRRWSLNDVWHQLQEAADPFDGVGRGGMPTLRTACFPYPGNVAVMTKDGERLLGDLGMTVALSFDAEQVDLEDATRVAYDADRKTRLHHVEFASRQARDDWAISLQILETSLDLGLLKAGGSWPTTPAERNKY